jgi:hypothetical protein
MKPCTKPVKGSAAIASRKEKSRSRSPDGEIEFQLRKAVLRYIGELKGDHAVRP